MKEKIMKILLIANMIGQLIGYFLQLMFVGIELILSLILLYNILFGSGLVVCACLLGLFIWYIIYIRLKYVVYIDENGIKRTRDRGIF